MVTPSSKVVSRSRNRTPKSFLLSVTVDEAIDIRDALHEETSEYRRRWAGYEHRLNVHWLLREEALINRINNWLDILGVNHNISQKQQDELTT